MLSLILRCQLDGGADGSQHAFVIGDVLTRDVEGCTVVNRRTNDSALQTNGDVHAFLDAHYLNWRMALVVIASYNNIEVAAASAEEECVRREWTNNVNAFLLRTLNAGLQLLFFFSVAEQSVLSGMRIDSAYGYARILKACFFNVSWASFTTV